MLAARGEAACTRGAGFHCAHKDLITLSSAQTCSKQRLKTQAIVAGLTHTGNMRYSNRSWSIASAMYDTPIVAGLPHTRREYQGVGKLCANQSTKLAPWG